MDNAYKLYQDLFPNYDSDIEIMERSFSIIVSKVNDWIESVIIVNLGIQSQYVTHITFNY